MTHHNEKSDRSSGAKNIGTQLATSDLSVCDSLDSGPVLGLKQHALPKPIRDMLLLQRRSLHDVRKAFGKGGLAPPGSADRASKSSNVRFLHEHTLYTNRFVSVNAPVCVTGGLPTCSVLQMPVNQRKTAPQAAPSNKRVAIPGPDGKTLGQRVAEAMAYESGRRGIAYEQKDLVDDVNRLVSTEGEGGQLLSQQQASAIMRGKVSRSTFTPYIAKACHVDGVWLARGAGAMIPKP